jgi:hypothetical protein
MSCLERPLADDFGLLDDVFDHTGAFETLAHTDDDDLVDALLLREAWTHDSDAREDE